jgi:hypothetical protein
MLGWGLEATLLGLLQFNDSNALSNGIQYNMTLLEIWAAATFYSYPLTPSYARHTCICWLLFRYFRACEAPLHTIPIFARLRLGRLDPGHGATIAIGRSEWKILTNYYVILEILQTKSK